ncbi:glycerol kinase GlpK [Mucilaginibacter myungsuensis]|uniref:Glycerol kinase n=1 Tax=Mucilaginibacter myungsuensis TaxID=649104 RepID=A0A929PV99_9SPHI|nr:glycerol kinase GlpK [Mucilaginibacter myungsuensis]MBE9661578.1 glycerol kinase GlpK [Mucilaginibacter myungsuensis]MDN3597721.1 glycerol kinase GlpK [Mucilaginibacter myungsuensis]
MEKYILSLDQGTTSSRAIVFNKAGGIVSVAQKEFKQIYPKPGWVEHNAIEIWSSQISVAAEAIIHANISAHDVAAIGITNQRETTILWDKRTGEPLYNAIVWQDRRTSAYCDELKAQGHRDLIQQKTGLILDAYFSATKIKWILDNVDGAREKAAAGHIAFGTVDSWLVWRLTGGQTHITDVSNASRTMIYNIHTLEWDEELLSLFDIPREILPQVKSSSEVYGKTAGNIFSGQIPIAGIAGDQQAALFGQMCTANGMVKNTYGTGCFMLMNIGDTPILSKNNLVTTIAWKVRGKVQYALEGSIFIAGAVVQWLRDELKIISSSADVETLALKVDDTGGVYIVPAFAGLGAPHWDQDARGTITGITRGTNQAHFARAALESIAYQTMDVLKAMEADSGLSIKQLRVDGGATANNLLMQFQADLLETEVIRPQVTEVTAIGAAYLAGLATGFWSSMDEISKQWQVERSFEPGNTQDIKQRIKGWNRAVKAAKAATQD